MRRNSFVQMALTGRLGVRLSGGGAASGLDAATVAFLARMTTPPDSTRQALINDLIVGLKADDVWDNCDEIWVPAAHNEQAALLGWKGYKDLTAVNAPTFTTDRGFTGNGTTSYLDTNFVPSTDGVQYTLNDASLGAYIRTNVDENVGVIGSGGLSNANASVLIPHFTNVSIVRLNNGASITETPEFTTGWLVGRRTASDTLTIRYNGSEVQSSATNTADGLTSRAMSICGYNNNGSYQSSTRQIAAAFVGAAMSEAQQLALFTRLETYLDAIGAGVVS